MDQPIRLRNEDFVEAVSQAVLRTIEGGGVSLSSGTCFPIRDQPVVLFGFVINVPPPKF